MRNINDEACKKGAFLDYIILNYSVPAMCTTNVHLKKYLKVYREFRGKNQDCFIDRMNLKNSRKGGARF